jgi:L-fuculose-phosphate aldolase
MAGTVSGSTMSEWKLREQMCEIGRRVYAKGFAAANDGNISYRLSEDRVLCTPTRVSKGFMKPDDLCIVDMDGKQVSGKRKRSSEILLHLSILQARPDARSCVHCHPPHATAFAVAHEPIPKCTMPEFEVFLGEVAITPYETPGTQAFADTVLPYIKDTDTILLANHGTITCGSDLEDAYFKTEIIDAYCRILLLTRQLGRVNYYDDAKAAELIKIKPGLGIRDPRLERGLENCDLCGNSLFREGYSDFVPEPKAFMHPKMMQAQGPAESQACPLPSRSSNGQAPEGADIEALVKTITDQVMRVMNGANGDGRGNSVVKDGGFASGVSGGV